MAIYDKYFKVAGVSFEGRQQTIEDLNGDEAVYLQLEPTNKFDPNAIAVWVRYPKPNDPTIILNDAHIGYVPSGLTGEIARMMKEECFQVEIDQIVGGFATSVGEKAAWGVVIRCEASYNKTGKW